MAFIFGGNTGETPETLRRKRSLAEALAVKTSAAPKNVGEGLNAIGNALIYRALMGKVDAGEAAGKATAASDAAALFGSPVAKALSSDIPMTDAAGEVSATSPASGGNYRDAIASIESAGSGDYAAVGPTHPKMGRALGRYQIMESNIGPWSQAALGRAVTPDEFMADPKLQDAIFDHQFGQYVQKYGPEGAAQAWLGGPGGVGKTGRRDSLGTSIGDYGQRFMKAVGGGTEVASLDPSAGMSAADAIEAVAPQSGGYRDPMVSAPNSRGAVANALMSTAPQTAQPSSVVAALSSPQVIPRNASDALPVGDMASTTNAAVAPRNQTVAQALSSSPAQLQPEYYPPAPSPAGQGGPSMQQIMQVLNNPYSSEANKAYAQSLLEQRQKQSDPDAQLNREYKRAQLDALKGKPTKTWQRLDDTTLFNPETGETQRVNAPAAGNGQFRFDGKSVEAQALNGLMDAGTLTPAQAQQLGAGKTITGPNGEIIFMTPQGVFGQSADGTVAPVSAPQAPTPPAPPQSPGGVDIFGGEAPAVPTPPAPPAPPQAPQQPPAAPQRQGMIPLTPPKPDKPTEAQRNRVGNVNQAFDAITGELDRYADLVDKTGIEAMPGADKDNLNTVRQGIMLQMKELFNLGVLNGPDLSLMEKMIYDPVIDPMKEGGLANIPGQIWAGATGSAGERAKNSVTELKRMLENIKSSVGNNSRPVGQGAPSGGADYKNRYGLE